MAENNGGRRVLRVERTIVEGPGTKPRIVHAKRASDFPGVSQAHLDVARKLSQPAS